MKHLFLIITIGLFTFTKAQDVIFQKNGEEIQAKIIEIETDNVKYKKFNNINGPIYNMAKNDIFMIKYQNGNKDVFTLTTKNNTNIDNEISKNNKKDKIVIEKDYSSYNVQNSSDKIIYDYQFDIQKVFNANSVFYYGFDFSNMVLINSKKVGQEQALNKYFEAWLEDFEGVVPFKKFKRYLNKENLISVQDKIQKRYILNQKNQWIKSSPNDITIENVVSIINEYNTVINEKEGVGLVLIVEAFNKPTERVSIIFTFFDIGTGKVLWVTKSKGEAGGKGFTRHWTIGMMESLRKYIDYSYKPTNKQKLLIQE